MADQSLILLAGPSDQDVDEPKDFGQRFLAQLESPPDQRQIRERFLPQLELASQVELVSLLQLCCENQPSLRRRFCPEVGQFCLKLLTRLTTFPPFPWAVVTATLRILEGVLLMLMTLPSERRDLCTTLQNLLRARFFPKDAVVRIECSIMSLGEPLVRNLLAPEPASCIWPSNLEFDLQFLASSLRPTMAETQLRQRAFACIDDVIFSCFGVRGRLFGSAVNGFDIRDSDLDISVILPKEQQQRLVVDAERQSCQSRDTGDWSWLYRSGSVRKACIMAVRILAAGLRAAGLDMLETIEGARVPIIRCWFPVAPRMGADASRNRPALEVDISFCNEVAYHNSRLLRAYADFDPRVAGLCRLVKLWAKRRNLNSPLDGTLSSYAYSLMVIHFMQRQGVLPNLQRPREETLKMIGLAGAGTQQTAGGHDVWFVSPTQTRADISRSGNSSPPMAKGTARFLPLGPATVASSVADAISPPSPEDCPGTRTSPGISVLNPCYAANSGAAVASAFEPPLSEHEATMWLGNAPPKTGLLSYLYGFFRYFAMDFNAYSSVVSIHGPNASKREYFLELSRQEVTASMEEADAMDEDDFVEEPPLEPLEVQWTPPVTDSTEATEDQNDCEKSSDCRGLGLDVVDDEISSNNQFDTDDCFENVDLDLTDTVNIGLDVDRGADAATNGVHEIEGVPKETLLIGVVKNYSDEQGFGFIECQEMFSRYGRDVFLHYKQAQANCIQVGSHVRFLVEFNGKGQPQARQVRNIEGADLEKVLQKRVLANAGLKNNNSTCDEVTETGPDDKNTRSRVEAFVERHMRERLCLAIADPMERNRVLGIALTGQELFAKEARRAVSLLKNAEGNVFNELFMATELDMPEGSPTSRRQRSPIPYQTFQSDPLLPSKSGVEVTFDRPIKKEMAGRVIGAKGNNLKNIRERSGVDEAIVKDCKSDSTISVLTVRGSMESVKNAMVVVDEILRNSGRNRNAKNVLHNNDTNALHLRHAFLANLANMGAGMSGYAYPPVPSPNVARSSLSSDFFATTPPSSPHQVQAGSCVQQAGVNSAGWPDRGGRRVLGEVSDRPRAPATVSGIMVPPVNASQPGVFSCADIEARLSAGGALLNASNGSGAMELSLVEGKYVPRDIVGVAGVAARNSIREASATSLPEQKEWPQDSVGTADVPARKSKSKHNKIQLMCFQ